MKNEVIDGIKRLAPWWEDVEVQGVRTGDYSNNCGRNKVDLFKNIFDKAYPSSFFRDKSILDIGCNAGGTLLELDKRGAGALKGIDASQRFIDQAMFVRDQSGKKWELERYRVGVSAEKMCNDLGTFDIIFCLGVIYHLKKDTVINLLEYMHKSGKNVIMSSQIQNSPARPSVDWNVGLEAIEALLHQAGFSNMNILFNASPNASLNWGPTNTLYFEAIV